MTFHHNEMRTGLNDTESRLTLANVNSSSFGLLRKLMVDSTVDAQPLYLSGLNVGGTVYNVVYIATENDTVYAYDVDGGGVLWHVSMLQGTETPSDQHNCGQVTPTIGVTSTPVIDRNAGKIYVVAMSLDSAGAYHQRLHALDLTTGAETAGSPVEITATYGSKTFDPGQYEERAGLLLSGGTIYTTWTSHCDHTAYGGWIITYSASTLARTGVLNIAATSDAGPAIWMAGGGPAVDAAGNVYLATANGKFDTTLDGNGFPSEGNYGNSLLKLSPAGAGLRVLDYFSPKNTVQLSTDDADLGSGGVMLLPDQTDASGAVRHLIVGAGKNTAIVVADRDAMGKFSPSADNAWQVLDQIFTFQPVFASPAYFNGTVYYCAVSSRLMAIPVQQAKLSTTPSSTTATSFGYPGCTPAVSANGTANGIVWAHENANPGVLHAYEAANLAHELYNSNQAPGGRDQFGQGNKFIAPAVVDGKVLVGAKSTVAVFGLLH